MTSKRFYSLGLIGYPLDHSYSPQIHGAALHALGLKGEYILYPIPPFPKGQNELTLLLARLRDGEIHGLNITIPHKQNVIPLLDKLTPAAKTIGAVNTIYLQDGLLVGDNTDAPGFWGDVQRLIGSGALSAENENSSFNLPHSSIEIPPSALILGSGGAARAVVYALLNHGWRVTLSARCEDQSQAATLKADLAVVGDPIEIICLETEDRSLIADRFSLLVNCTPAGMHPNQNESAWPADLPLPLNAAVYDLVYNPRETLLVKRARAAGLPATTGLGMLVEQAALAFELWTGLGASRKVMLEAVNF